MPTIGISPLLATVSTPGVTVRNCGAATAARRPTVSNAAPAPTIAPRRCIIGERMGFLSGHS
jgi:hypothetical protein